MICICNICGAEIDTKDSTECKTCGANGTSFIPTPFRVSDESSELLDPEVDFH